METPVLCILKFIHGSGYDPSDSDDNKLNSALSNIGQQLEMMCGGTMTILPRDGGGTVVTITIPPAQATSEPISYIAVR